MTDTPTTAPPGSAPRTAASAAPPPRQFLLLLAVAAVVGTVSAAAASGFYWLQHETEEWLWKDLPTSWGATTQPQWWWVVIVLVAGAVAVWAARKLPGNGGHRPLLGFGMDIGPREVASVLLAGFATLVSGAVLGPEAPLIAVGTAVGALAVRRAQAPVVKVMMLAGGMGAIGTIFGNPLVTALLMLEALVMAGGGAAIGMALVPAMVALACGYLIQTGIGDWPGLGHAQLSLPELAPVSTPSAGDLGAAVIVAIVACLVTAIAREIGERVERVQDRALLPTLVGGAVVTAAVALTVIGLTDQNIQVVLFSGESGIPFILTETSVATILLVMGAKALAYGIALGGGWRAGPVFPSAFLGVTVAVLGAVMVPSLSQTMLVAAGIGAAAAFTMRLVVTGALLGVMLTVAAGAAVTPAAILGAVVGVLARKALDAFDARRGATLGPFPGTEG